MPTMNLAEWAQQSKEPAVRLLVKELLQDSNSILDRLPFTNIDTQSARIQTWKGLPTFSFRPIGQGSYATLTARNIIDVVYNVYDIGGKHEIDHVLMKDKGTLRDPREIEMQAAREGLIRTFNTQFILGRANLADGFPGLDDWFADNAAQTKDRASAPILASVAAEHAFIDDLREMWTFMPNQTQGPDVILCNLDGYLGLERVLRRAGVLATTKDQYDRQFNTFMGAPIINVGSKTGDRGSSDYIIPSAAGPTTRFYFVKFGVGYVEGLQMEPLHVEDIGYTSESDRTVYKILVRWLVGVAVGHRYSVARLINCKFATS